MTSVMLNSKILNGVTANVLTITMVFSAILSATRAVSTTRQLRIVLQFVQGVVLVTLVTAMAPVVQLVNASAMPGGLQVATVCSAVWAVAKIVRPNEASVSRLVDNCNVCVIQDILVNLVNSPVVPTTTNPVLAMANVK